MSQILQNVIAFLVFFTVRVHHFPTTYTYAYVIHFWKGSYGRRLGGRGRKRQERGRERKEVGI